MTRWIKKGFRWWPDDGTPRKGADLIRMYESGFVGTYYDPDSRAAFHDSIRAFGGEVSGSDLATSIGFADSGAGKLCLSFLAPVILFPNCYPGAAQERGDCVSHGAAGAFLISFANEIYRGMPDEVTGTFEGVPELPQQGIREGVVSSAWMWWLRRSGGDGWDCSTAVRRMVEEGVMLMTNYADLGFDLTDYNYSTTAKYARSGPPANALAASKEHRIRQATECDSFEATRDFIYQGYGIIDCGSQGWESTRNENGVSRRRGGWSHSMKEAAIDDRDVIKQKYGEPLLLIVNNWGRWNSGPRDIYQSAHYVPPALKQRWIALDLVNPTTGNIMIPEGSYWTKWSEAKNRYRVAVSSAMGWPARKTDFLVV